MYDIENSEIVAYAPFFGYMGAATAQIFSVLGAAYGTAKAAVGIYEMGIQNPRMIIKAVIPVVMAGVIAIYGLVLSLVLKGKIHEASEGYTLDQGFSHLAAGLTVGLCGLASGYATGIVSDAGVRSMGRQPKMFIGMILVLIFAGALALYGLIAGLIIATPA